MTLAHDHDALRLPVADEEQEHRRRRQQQVDIIVNGAVRRVAGRERVRTRYRIMWLATAGLGLIGLALVVLGLVWSDAPEALIGVEGLAAALTSMSVGILVGSRLEYRRRADRTKLLLRLSEVEIHTTSTDGSDK